MAKEMEFVVIQQDKYSFWKMTPELKLLYQQGDQPKSLSSSSYTTGSFYLSNNGMNILLLALSNGKLFIIDTITNTLLQEM